MLSCGDFVPEDIFFLIFYFKKKLSTKNAFINTLKTCFKQRYAH